MPYDISISSSLHLLRKSSGRTQECVINKKITGKLKRIGFFGFLFNFPEVNFNSLLI